MQNPTLSGLFLLIGLEIYDHAARDHNLFLRFPRVILSVRRKIVWNPPPPNHVVTCNTQTDGDGLVEGIQLNSVRNENQWSDYTTVYSANSLPSRSFRRRRLRLGVRCVYRFFLGGGVDLFCIFRTA